MVNSLKYVVIVGLMLCVSLGLAAGVAAYRQDAVAGSSGILPTEQPRVASVPAVPNATWGEGSCSAAWSDGTSIYATGSTRSYGVNEYGLAIVKWDMGGHLIWNKTWDWSFVEIGLGIWGDGTYIYTSGYVDYYDLSNDQDFVLIKWDTSGNKIWNKTWGGPTDEMGYSVWGDGTYLYTCGYTDSYGAGSTDLAIVKWDTSGNVLWNRTWGGPSEDRGYSIWGDGTFIYTGGSTSSYGSGMKDLALVQWDASGTKIWNKTWGAVNMDECKSVWGDGNFIYTGGYTETTNHGDDDILIKWNPSGNIVWNKTFDDNVANDLISSVWGDGVSIYTGGTRNGQMAIAKWDPNGNVIWTLKVASYYTWGTSSIFGSGTSLYIAGTTFYAGLGNRFVLMWFDVSVNSDLLPVELLLVAAIAIGIVTGVLVKGGIIHRNKRQVIPDWIKTSPWIMREGKFSVPVGIVISALGLEYSLLLLTLISTNSALYFVPMGLVGYTFSMGGVGMWPLLLYMLLGVNVTLVVCGIRGTCFSHFSGTTRSGSGRKGYYVRGYRGNIGFLAAGIGILVPALFSVLSIPGTPSWFALLEGITIIAMISPRLVISHRSLEKVNQHFVLERQEQAEREEQARKDLAEREEQARKEQAERAEKARKEQVLREILARKEQERQQHEWDTAHAEFLGSLEGRILGEPNVNERVVPLEGMFAIPQVHGKAICELTDVVAAAERLLASGKIQGILYNNTFYSEAALIKLLKDLANTYPAVGLSDLAERFQGIDNATLRKMLQRLVEQKKAIVDFDLARNEIVLRRKLDAAALNMLNGIIKLEKRIDLNRAQELLRVTKDDVRNLIYQLAGQNAIEGHFDGDVFVIESDVGSFIDSLNQSFADWDKKAETKEGKA